MAFYEIPEETAGAVRGFFREAWCDAPRSALSSPTNAGDPVNTGGL